MREVKPVTSATGTTTYRVRYRHGKQQTSQTFRQEADARTFAAILDAGGVGEAHAWVATRNSGQQSAWTFATWFEHYVDHLTGVTVRTRDDYRDMRRRYLTSLDTLPLDHLSRAHVAKVVNDMDTRGLSPKTIKNTVQMLSACMAVAVMDGHLARNPAKGVRLPESRADTEGEDDVAKFLTHAEFAHLLAEIPLRWQPLVVFLVGTGARWGEATAVMGRHVNVAARTVRIERAWKKGTSGFYVGPPKSKKSRRTVDAAHQAIVAAEVAGLSPNELVFTNRSGKPISYSNFYHRVWRPACVRASVCPAHRLDGCRCTTTKPQTCPHHAERDSKGNPIPAAPCGCPGMLTFRPGLHALRHTHASWLIAMGCSLEQVQDQLGHESIVTTRSVYGHLLPSVRKLTGEAAGRALGQVPSLASLTDGPERNA